MLILVRLSPDVDRSPCSRRDSRSTPSRSAAASAIGSTTGSYAGSYSTHVRSFGVAFLPLVGTVVTLAVLVEVGVGDPSMLVLGGALCLTQARRSEGALLRLPLVVLATAGLGLVFAHSMVAADVLYLVVFAAARMAWRLGPAAATAGRALLLPLVALFIAPPVALATDPGRGVLQVLLACAVATAWTAAVPRLWPPGPPSIAALARAARRRRRVPAAALELDGRLPPNATDARLAVLAVEHAAEQGHDVTEPLARARAALATLPPYEQEQEAEAPTERAKEVRTRLAIQSTAAVGLAFLAGQQLFGPHWPWTVITVLTVSLRATSRGEVAITAAERVLGALAGTVVATAVGAAAMPGPVAGTLLILAVLGAGMALRPYGYAWWAAAMTAALSLLYGLLGQPSGLDLLGERLLAILLGGACAVLPYALLAPVRTRAAVRRRVGVTLRALGAALREGPTVQNTRAADRALDALRLRSRPLRLTARLRPTLEADWAGTLLDAGPALHTALLDPASGSRSRLGAVVRSLAADVRST
jgi:Fusaric acid resistance protein-like